MKDLFAKMKPSYYWALLMVVLLFETLIHAISLILYISAFATIGIGVYSETKQPISWIGLVVLCVSLLAFGRKFSKLSIPLKESRHELAKKNNIDFFVD